MPFLPLFTALLGLTIVLVVAPFALRACLHSGFLVRSADLHHTHQTRVPRIGGLLLVAAFLAVELFIQLVIPVERERTPGRTAALVCSLAMFGLGFWDDISPLGAKKKLLGQILIAAAVVLSGIGIQQFTVPFSGERISLGPWGVVFTIVWLVALTNLINLIDGADGLAGGICLMLMLLIAFVGHQNGNFELLASGMAGALLGFLWYNFPPARIYLGDGGAYFLGFQIGLFSIINSHKGTVFAALVAPLFVLALPILDTSLAILRRGLRGLPIFRPDRRHIHHRLITMGASRRRVVLSIYAVTLVFLVMGLLAYWSRGNLVPVLLGAAVVLLLLLAGNLKFSREWFSVGRVLGNSIGMRGQVRYALSLAQWLELEGERQASIDGLFTDLCFAARKLGFASLTTVGPHTLTWRDPAQMGQGRREASFRVRTSNGAYLELSALVCPIAESLSCRAAFNNACAGLCDERRLEISSELLAEGWANGLARLEKNLRSRSLAHPVPYERPAVARVWPGALASSREIQEGNS